MKENNQESRWEWTLEWSKHNKHVRRLLLGFLVILVVVLCVYIIIKCSNAVLLVLTIVTSIASIYLVGALIEVLTTDSGDFD